MIARKVAKDIEPGDVILIDGRYRTIVEVAIGRTGRIVVTAARPFGSAVLDPGAVVRVRPPVV